MSEALKIIQDPTLTYRQELVGLAHLGESTDDSLRYSDAYYTAKKKGALCDLNEGVMPFRPRYICPDYELLFQKGCGFLQLDPPKDLLEAVNSASPVYWPKDEEHLAKEAGIKWKTYELYTPWTDRNYPLMIKCGTDEEGVIYRYLQTTLR